MQWRVIVGTLSFVVTMIFLGFVAVTEQDRMASFTLAYDSRSIETGAALFEANCQNCHGNRGQGFEGVAPALDSADMFNGARLAEMGFAGTVESYVQGAIAAGRPRPSAAFANYPQRMPTWGEDYGGPLRNDQVKALTAFIMNWGKNYEAGAAPIVVIDGVGTDITISLPAGNAKNGEALSTSKGCVGCHINATVGPAWLASADPNGQGAGARAAERFSAAGYTGAATSAEQYLFESIVQSNAYLVEGFQPNIMPQTYGKTLTEQEAADLIAYLLTLK